MARGRFISNAIMSDKKINELSDDTSRLAFTWLITTADVEGRTYGDPAMVRSLLFPRRIDITVEQIKAYMTEWAAHGIIEWYTASGDLWIAFPNFDKHQVNLRKDREPESFIPAPDMGTPVLSDAEIIRIVLGNDPADIRQTSGKMTGEDKLREEKLREDKRSKGKRADKALRDSPAETPAGVVAYREAAHRYPNKSLYALIDQHVGNDPQRVDLWKQIVIAWISQGWNPSNISGQLECFDRNEIPNKNGNRSGKNPMLQALAELHDEETRNGNQ